MFAVGPGHGMCGDRYVNFTSSSWRVRALNHVQTLKGTSAVYVTIQDNRVAELILSWK